MGVWGTGLYSGDFAADLRSTIGAVARLPFDADRLVELLCECEPGPALDSQNEEHTTFWLIVADQFAKRGIVCERVRQRAFEIIDRFQDLAMLQKLGMKASDIDRRRKLLLEVRARVATAQARSRAVLKKPQPLLMHPGDVIVYPTCLGKCINPYFPSKETNTTYRSNGPSRWVQDGWGAALIVDCGRAFDFLSWYRPLTLVNANSRKPTLDFLLCDLSWRLQSPATCSPAHFRKMELERIGAVPVDPEKLAKCFPDLRPGISAAVNDISIANRLAATPPVSTGTIPKLLESGRSRGHTLLGIHQLLKE